MSPVFLEGSAGKRGREAARPREREKKQDPGGKHPEGRNNRVLSRFVACWIHAFVPSWSRGAFPRLSRDGWGGEF